MASPLEHVNRIRLNRRGFSSRWITTRSGRVHVIDGPGEGDLPPLVLLHGLGTAGVHFGPFVHFLQKRFRRIIVPDIPAHGFSEIPSQGASLEGLRAGLLDALDHVVDEPSVVYGNSMGGFAAIGYALDRPDKVRSLVLCSPGGAPTTDDRFTELRRLFRPTSHADALAFIDRLFVKRYKTRHLIALGVRRSFQRPMVQSLLTSVESEQFLTPGQLAQLSMPLLFIWGKSERILPAENFHFFRDHLPTHATVCEPDGFGHSPHIEHPRRLAGQIADFIAAGAAPAA